MGESPIPISRGKEKRTIGVKKRIMKKKGLTEHHICYNPEFKIKTSRGGHLVLTAFQSMKPTKENIKKIDDYIKALLFIKWQKESLKEK